MRTAIVCGTALLLLACAGGPAPSPEPPPPEGGLAGGNGSEAPPPPKIPPHETYLRNPTSVSADEVRVILPLSYAEEIRVRGLSAGWREEQGDRVWEGTGACELSLLSLTVRAKSLSVTLEPAGEEPQVILQAIGDVSFAHSVKGVGTLLEGRRFLQLSNRRQLVE